MNDNLVDILLRELPNAKLASANREITCRCVYCGGSKRDRNKRSMYIKIPQSDDDVMLYNCYRADCSAKGLVTEETLIDWGIYDKNALLSLANHNKKALGKAKNRRYKLNDKIIYNIHNNKVTKDKYSEYKLNYINSRLGTHFDYYDLLQFKIVLNLYDLLEENRIHSLTRDKSITDKINMEYIGFLNVDNGLLNCRTVNPEETNMRYINYNLFHNSSPQRFYVMPGSVDNRLPVNVYITEGMFDILSVYHNLNKKSEPNSVFACVFGASYYSLMKWFILDANLRRINFHIYADADVPIEMLYRLKELADKTRSGLIIHTNQYPGEKDFGVPLDRIKDSIMSI